MVDGLVLVRHPRGAALERVIHRALRKQPERRFQSVADMRIELLETQEQLATGDVLLAEQVVRDDRARHTARWWWAMAAVVLALIIGSAGWYYIETSKPSGPRFATPTVACT